MENFITMNRALAAKRHLFTLILALMAGVGTVFANSETGVDGIYYIFHDDTKTAEVTGYGNDRVTYVDAYNGYVIIPDTVLYEETKYCVNRIGDKAFRDNKGLISVEIPNTVTSIGDGAFYGCSSLNSLEIPNTVTSIGTGVFSGCGGLTSIIIGDGITEIESRAFSSCSS